jgi:hypothetical protein
MPTMATYTGPATLILPDGSEIDVDANLRSYTQNNLAAWAGTVMVDAPTPMWNAKGETCVLRTKDGTTGSLVIFGVGGDQTREVGDIRGRGPAPF